MKEIQQLFFQWFRAYPGLWLSPLGLVLLGGWMWLQPGSVNASRGSVLGATEGVADTAAATRTSGPSSAIAPSAEPSTTATAVAASTSPNVLVTRAADFDASAPSAYQERPTLKGAAGAAGSATATIATDMAKGTAKGTAKADKTGKTDAELAAGPGAAANSKTSAAPSAQDIAAAKAEVAAQEKQLAAARGKKPPAPAPNVVNGGNPAVDQAIIMQVAIAQGDTNLSMGVSDAGVMFTPQGQALAQVPAGRNSLACKGGNLVLNGQQSLPSTVMMAPGAGGMNYVRDRTYRGQMQFFCQGDGVLAVNHIDLLHYLYSVVGSEVSASWPIASLKAQTVAARSYGLTYYFRPATEHFHIGDSESYQVYKGVETEDQRVMQAVHETAGEFISYDGGIVESLYAASDEIVMDAFKGGGMSQTGARDLSQQGYNYLQILGYYYPKTSLGRLALDTGS